jgi:uncharacterized protein
MTLTRTITGPAGDISIAIENSAQPARGLALVAHPHPLFGGTRDNKVVQSIARALLAMGYDTWRPNFRGVGDTTGSFDHGQGETDDMAKVLQAASEDYLARHGHAPAELVLAGFSFGSAVQARLFQRLKPASAQAQGTPAIRLVLVGTAVSRFEVPEVPESTLLIHGDLDDTVPLADVLAWARPQQLAVVVVSGADHFFHRRLTQIKRIIWRAWAREDLATQSLALEEH